MTPKPADRDHRILILTPYGKDGALLCKVLAAQGFDCEECKSVPDLISMLGEGAGALLLTEEVLISKGGATLLEHLKTQPSWSAIPVITFYGKRTSENEIERRAQHPLQAHTEITFLERPVSTTTLLSAIRAALRDRARQYQVKNLLEALEADISRRAQHEVELIAARQAAEIANQSKTQFLANMSHEIRTPLGAIMGFAELMQEDGQDAAERKEYLDTILRNGKQLANLVNDLLDISKVEAGRMEAEILEFPLADMVLDIEKLFQPVAQGKGLELKVEFKKPLPERIFSDPTRLRQILINLIGNSLKFTSQGYVKLTIEKQKLKGRPKEIQVVFKVEDSGPGMTENEQSRIFETFMQGDSSTTRKFGGTGLGLALSRDLAKLLGGDLFVGASKVGIGTQMVLQIHGGVELPSSFGRRLDGHAAAHAEEDSEAATPLKGLSILLVEDSTDIQALISRILENSGAAVAVANDGDEGVVKALGGDYDLILMDIQMPNKDGYSAARELRDQGYVRPMIALTAHAMREDREKSERAGFSAYLTKPINRSLLIRTITEQRALRV